MQRALIAGLAVAVTCAILGVFLVLRKDAMIGHGLAHVTFGGVALGLFLQVTPILAAMAVSILAALGILKLKEKAGLYEDTALGIFSSVGMAVGIILVSLAGSFNVNLLSFLFGNILAIEPFEVWVSLGLTVAVLLTVSLFYHELFYLTFDPESAATAGIKVKRLEAVLAVLSAITVVLGMKVVGILLVAALMVIPSAAGLMLAGNFRQAMLISAVVAILSVFLGLLSAFYWDLPASGSIVILSFLFFLILFSVRVLKRRVNRAKSGVLS
ncbi:MAG: metal ABC transporter permease [Deltaproteobacteria bacterium]|nr:metal ABC transporter permease [Deltaproteobacteria bacterium]